MMRTYNLPKLFNESFWNNSVFEEFDKFYNTFGLVESETKTKFPPYNIISEGDNPRIEVALAGYTKENVNIEFDEIARKLFISASSQSTDEKFTHKGISSRSFKLEFNVSKTVDIIEENVTMENGLLVIPLLKKEEALESNKVKKLLIK